MADRTLEIEATFSPRVLREYALLADGERGYFPCHKNLLPY